MTATVYTCKCEICNEIAVPAIAKNGYSIFRCTACGFLFVYPWPSAAEISAFYNNNYRGAEGSAYPKARSRARRAFFKSFLFWKYLYKKRAIDVGCGGGFMVNAFHRLGAEAHGIDISEKAIDYASKQFPACTFYCDSFAALASRKLVFDFIFTTELIEHIPGPRDFMQMISSISRTGTVLYIATPDSGHAKVPADLSLWEDICPPEHLQWFNQSNMTRLFSQYGFSPIRMYTKPKPSLAMLFRKA